MAQPLKYYRNHIGGAVSLLQAMQAAGCRTLVFSSSATVYPALTQSLLGWHATHTLADMCVDAWRWHQGNPVGMRLILAAMRLPWSE